MNLGSARPVVLAPNDFGLTNVLDSFVRADQNPLATASNGDTWGTDTWIDNPFGNLSVQSNKLVFQSPATQGSQALSASYGPVCEASFTVDSYNGSTPATMWVLIRGAVTGVAQANGYGMVLSIPLAAQGTPPCTFDISLFRVTAGVQTYLRFGRIGSVAFGSSFGLGAFGSTITGWYKPSGSSVWQPRISAVDATYSAAGRIGLSIDDTYTISTLRGGTR